MKLDYGSYGGLFGSDEPEETIHVEDKGEWKDPVEIKIPAGWHVVEQETGIIEEGDKILGLGNDMWMNTGPMSLGKTIESFGSGFPTVIRKTKSYFAKLTVEKENGR